MTMNKLTRCLLLLCVVGSLPLCAQNFAPLGGYDLPGAPGKPLPTRAKMDCDGFATEGFVRLAPGETEITAPRFDTIGLGPVTAECINCADAAFGTATFTDDTLTYVAAAAVEEGLDELRLRACNAAGECSPEVTVSLLVQRDGRTIALPNQTVAPSATIDIVVPLGEIPDRTFCRTVASCNDDYPGREQRVFFQFGINQDNEIRYVAARAGGTDRVCVTLCTELGLCDVYTVDITVNRPLLTLPFFDDFSYDGFRPDEDLWQDEDVLVNRNFAVLPPSIGVATFDAVDFDGRPYTTVSGTGPTKELDYLTSGPIDLAGRNGTVLNFYLQPRGLGNRPERQDSFLVQFLDQDENWQTVLGVQGVLNTVGNTDTLPFVPYTIPLEDEFIYRGFQFRFANKGNERGAVDMWHLDYVKLSNESTTLITQDLALVQMPEILLEPYTSLPLRHYQAVGPALLRDSLTLTMRNFRNDVTPITTPNINIRRPDGSVIPGASGGLISTNLFPGDSEVAPFSFDRRRADLAGWNGFTPLVDYLGGLDPDQSICITNFYALFVATEELGFAPGIFENSNVGTPTCFDEYLAYDDGTAEVVIEIDEGGTIVQAYETYVNDELIGVQVRLPRGLGAPGDQPLKLVVYSGDTMPETLVYSEEFEILFPETFFFDSLQGFTTYLFDEPLDLPAGTIFVGWEQQRGNRKLGIGFDRNNSPPGVQWFTLGQRFERLEGATTGAIMIRPLLSGFEGFPTDTDEPVVGPNEWVVYPNPTSGTLHLYFDAAQRPRPGHAAATASFRLFGVSGNLIATGSNTTEVNLADHPAGVYLLELTDGTHRERHRIVKQ